MATVAQIHKVFYFHHPAAQTQMHLSRRQVSIAKLKMNGSCIFLILREMGNNLASIKSAFILKTREKDRGIERLRIATPFKSERDQKLI